MAAKRFRCPCCDERLSFDPKTGLATAVDPAKAKKSAGLDDLLKDHKRESERLGSVLDHAKDRQKRDAARLDDEFKKAAKDSKGDKSRPRNPFDLE